MGVEFRWTYTSLLLKAMKTESLNLVFLYHLISLNFLTYFSPMTCMTFLKYLFLLNLVTSNSPDFSTCLAIPFQSLLRIPLPQFILLSVCTRIISFYTLSLVFHFHGFSFQPCAEYVHRSCTRPDLSGLRMPPGVLWTFQIHCVHN